MFGSYVDLEQRAGALARVEVEFAPLDMVADWRRCGEMADFFGAYFSHDFADRRTAENTLSPVINELLENLVKFATDKKRPVRVVMYNLGEVLAFETHNECNPSQAERLGTQVQMLADRDAEDLFVEQVEYAAAEDPSASGLGFITLKKDYQAIVGARLIQSELEGQYNARVQVRLGTQEIG